MPSVHTFNHDCFVLFVIDVIAVSTLFLKELVTSNQCFECSLKGDTVPTCMYQLPAFITYACENSRSSVFCTVTEAVFKSRVHGCVESCNKYSNSNDEFCADEFCAGISQKSRLRMGVRLARITDDCEFVRICELGLGMEPGSQQ